MYEYKVATDLMPHNIYKVIIIKYSLLVHDATISFLQITIYFVLSSFIMQHSEDPDVDVNLKCIVLSSESRQLEKIRLRLLRKGWQVSTKLVRLVELRPFKFR